MLAHEIWVFVETDEPVGDQKPVLIGGVRSPTKFCFPFETDGLLNHQVVRRRFEQLIASGRTVDSSMVVRGCGQAFNGLQTDGRIGVVEQTSAAETVVIWAKDPRYLLRMIYNDSGGWKPLDEHWQKLLQPVSIPDRVRHETRTIWIILVNTYRNFRDRVRSWKHWN